MRTSAKLAVVSMALVTIGACGRTPALLRQVEKVGVVNNIQKLLLESVEAEKSAVLAITDEESIEFAGQSRQAVEQIDKLKAHLADVIHADERQDEIDKLAVFSAKWDELKAIDARLLDLAVANTNLKAARLLARDGSTKLDALITSVDAMTLALSDVAVVRSLAQAATAVARIQSLLFVHIPEASDAEMTALEAQIAKLSATVDTALRDVGPLVPSTASAAATAAAADWAEYQRIVAEVIRLSRLNTNVISFDVSIHEKRTATRACLDALADLRTSIQSGPQPTR